MRQKASTVGNIVGKDVPVSLTEVSRRCDRRFGSLGGSGYRAESWDGRRENRCVTKGRESEGIADGVVDCGM